MTLHYVYARSGARWLLRPKFVVQHVRTGEYLDAAGAVVPVLDDAVSCGTVRESEAAIERQDCRGAWVIRQVA